MRDLIYQDNVKTWLDQCNLTLPEEKIGDFLSVIKYKSLERSFSCSPVRVNGGERVIP